MNIDVRTNEVVYITINDKVIYIDYSTEELIIDTWKVDGEDIDDEIQTSKFEDILFEHDCYPLDKVTETQR